MTEGSVALTKKSCATRGHAPFVAGPKYFLRAAPPIWTPGLSHTRVDRLPLGIQLAGVGDLPRFHRVELLIAGKLTRLLKLGRVALWKEHHRRHTGKITHDGVLVCVISAAARGQWPDCGGWDWTRQRGKGGYVIFCVSSFDGEKSTAVRIQTSRFLLQTREVAPRSRASLPLSHPRDTALTSVFSSVSHLSDYQGFAWWVEETPAGHTG